jgi:hypothetical protein
MGLRFAGVPRTPSREWPSPSIYAEARYTVRAMSFEGMEPRQTARAQERRRRAQRRRLAAAASVTVVVVAAAAVALASSGGGSTDSKPARLPVSRAQAAPGTPGAGHPAAPAGQGGAAPGTGTGTPGTASVPVLMYHVIAPPPPGAPYPGL